MIGNDISLSFVNYTYYKDRSRFNGIPKEGEILCPNELFLVVFFITSAIGYSNVTQTFKEGNITIGQWKKVYRCKDVAIRLPGGVIVELRSLRLTIFRVKEAKEG